MHSEYLSAASSIASANYIIYLYLLLCDKIGSYKIKVMTVKRIIINDNTDSYYYKTKTQIRITLIEQTY